MGLTARQEVMSSGPCGPGCPPVAGTGLGRALQAQPGTSPGGETTSCFPPHAPCALGLIPELLSSVFQRSHRTPARLAGGRCLAGVVQGGVSPGAVPPGKGGGGSGGP